MNAVKWDRVLHIVLAIAAITSIVYWFIGDQNFTISFIVDCIGASATVVTIVSCFFCNSAWKWGIFRDWLVLIPDLNGVWEGQLVSDWVNPETGEPTLPIDATLTIKQKLFRTSCVLETAESTSYSITAEFINDPDSQVCKLVYSYQSDPNQTIQERSRIHYGTAMLSIKHKPDGVSLDGSYWSGRGTSGQMNFMK